MVALTWNRWMVRGTSLLYPHQCLGTVSILTNRNYDEANGGGQKIIRVPIHARYIPSRMTAHRPFNATTGDPEDERQQFQVHSPLILYELINSSGKSSVDSMSASIPAALISTSFSVPRLTVTSTEAFSMLIVTVVIAWLGTLQFIRAALRYQCEKKSQ